MIEATKTDDGTTIYVAGERERVRARRWVARRRAAEERAQAEAAEREAQAAPFNNPFAVLAQD